MRLTRTTILAAWILVAAAATGPSAAPAQQNPFAASAFYTAQSNTALSITGTVRFSSKAIGINGKSYPLTLAHTLTAEELANAKPVFSIDNATTGYLFKTSIPGNAPMLNKNSLCNAKCTWALVVYTAPDQLNIAFFTGDATPSLVAGAISKSPSLSGTYWYAKVRK
jgi:hypothetical protein